MEINIHGLIFLVLYITIYVIKVFSVNKLKHEKIKKRKTISNMLELMCTVLVTIIAMISNDKNLLSSYIIVLFLYYSISFFVNVFIKKYEDTSWIISLITTSILIIDLLIIDIIGIELYTNAFFIGVPFLVICMNNEIRIKEIEDEEIRIEKQRKNMLEFVILNIILFLVDADININLNYKLMPVLLVIFVVYFVLKNFINALAGLISFLNQKGNVKIVTKSIINIIMLIWWVCALYTSTIVYSLTKS